MFRERGPPPRRNLDTAAGDDLIYVSSGAVIEALDEYAAAGDLGAFHDQVLHADRVDPDPTNEGPAQVLRDGGTLDYIQGPLTIEAGEGDNALAVSDRNDPDPDDTDVTITDELITGLAPADISYMANGGTFSGQGKWNLSADFGDYGRGTTIYAGTGGNTIAVESIHSSGELSLPFEREITTLFSGRGGDTVYVSVADDDGAFLVVRGEAGDDTIEAIESTYNVATSTLPLSLFGDEGADIIEGGSNVNHIFGDQGRIHYFRPEQTNGYDILIGGAPVEHIMDLVGDSDFQTPDLLHTVINSATDDNDQITSLGSNDIIIGGGNDVSEEASPLEAIVAGDGDNIVLGDYGKVVLRNSLPILIASTDAPMGGADQITNRHWSRHHSRRHRRRHDYCQ